MARITVFFALFLVVFIAAPPSTQGKRILLLPYSFGSLVKQFHTIGEGLADSGHDVYMAIAQSLPMKELYMGGKVKVIIHESREIDFFNMVPKKLSHFIMRLKKNGDFIKSFRENHEEWLHMCTNPLGSEDFYETLKKLNFEMAVVNIFAISQCLVILPYSLGIPYVGVTTMYEPWLSRSPVFPSVVPNNLLGKVYTDHMDFGERLQNLLQNIDWIAFPRTNFLSDDNLKGYIRNKPILSLNELTSRCLLFLLDVDSAIDYPRAKMPNEINIGGLTTKPAKPLPKVLQDYMDSAKEGVIVVTFGSTSFSLDADIETEFIKAFAQINNRVLWKYNGDVITDLSSNVKVMKWIPQNDILGHPNAKLFITHCGNNGQMEALYHGIPMIGFPFYADQPYNCKRIHSLHYGICLNSHDFKADDLVNAVKTILTNDSYSKNIQHASKVFKDSPFTPLDRAVYWINHVMKYGGQHLHSHALDMPWYEYLMLDIAVFLLVVILIIMVALACFVTMIWKRFLRPHAKKD